MRFFGTGPKNFRDQEIVKVSKLSENQKSAIQSIFSPNPQKFKNQIFQKRKFSKKENQIFFQF